MQTCKKCGETKDAADFKSKTQCRACYNAYQLAWYHAHREQVTARWRDQRAAAPEEIRAKSQVYRDAHREQKREMDRRWKAKDPERNRKSARDWALANPERYRENLRRAYLAKRDERLATSKAYAESHKEELLAYQRNYYAANQERINEVKRKRYALDPVKTNEGSRRRRIQKRAIGQLLGSHTAAEWRSKLATFDGRCAICGTTETIVRDHIIPLSKGGADTIDNIQPLCFSCNSRKSARMD